MARNEDFLFDNIEDECEGETEDSVALREALVSLYDLTDEDVDFILLTHGDDVLPLRGDVNDAARKILSRAKEWGDTDDFEGIF